MTGISSLVTATTLPATVSDTTAETDIYSVTIPAATLVAGSVRQVTLLGRVGNQATSGALTLRAYLAGVLVATAVLPSATSSGSASTQGFKALFDLHVKAGGAAGTVIGLLEVLANMGGSYPPRLGGGVLSSAIDLTTDQTLAITAQWATASASNSLVREAGRLAVVGP